MAVGPHSSNAVETYLIKTIAQELEPEEYIEVIESERYDGGFEWPGLEELNENIEDRIKTSQQQNNIFQQSNIDSIAEGYFQQLDQIYDALKASDDSSRIYGLESLHNNSEPPKSGSTWWRWRKEYNEAALIDSNEENLTQLGEQFLTTSKDSHLDLDEIYRSMRTTSDDSFGENNGQKIKAFMLYGSGAKTEHVIDEVDLDYENLNQFRQNMQEINLLREDFSLTIEGVEMYSTIVDQIELLEKSDSNFSNLHL